jgi:hypothetical protein
LKNYENNISFCIGASLELNEDNEIIIITAMGLYKYKYVAVLCVSIVTIACNITRSNGSKFKYNISSWKFCLKSDHILTTLTQVTLSQCVDECATRTYCQAVNYFKSYHICELIPDNNGVLFETTKVNRGCVLVKKTDIITTEVIFFRKKLLKNLNKETLFLEK